MAQQESQVTAIAQPQVVNFLSALAPTQEGLFMVTTLDGRKGKILLRYHASQAEPFERLCLWLIKTYGEGFRILTKNET